MDVGMIFLLVLGIAVAAVISWNVIRPIIQARVPKGWSLGPIVNGKNRSVNVKLVGQAFDFPHPDRAAGHVHGLLLGGYSLKGRSEMTLRYRVDAAIGVTFHAQEDPSLAGEVSLMIQRKGDDYSAVGVKNFYRLYGPVAQRLEAGTHELTVPLSPEGWAPVDWGTATRVEFDDVVDNLAAIHVCFGAPGGREHGVFATGPSRFEVLALT